MRKKEIIIASKGTWSTSVELHCTKGSVNRVAMQNEREDDNSNWQKIPVRKAKGSAIIK